MSLSYAEDVHLEELQTPSLMTLILRRSINIDTFKKRMYDWASSMTSSGRNMPFSLPLRTRQTAEGFDVWLSSLYTP